MTASVRPNKSTTVRSSSAGVRAARAGFRVLSPHAPALAARWAEHLFLTPRRHARPSWEREALASATPGRVGHEGSWLPTWTWSPAEAPAGATKTVILVHGWEGRGSQLANFVGPLLESGFRVVTFDAPGHGDATLPRGSVVEHANALVSVGRAVGPVHAVIAHSVGGAAALFATRRGFVAERFALVAPPLSPSQFMSAFAEMLGIGDAVRQALIARIEARYSVPFSEIDARLDAPKLSAKLLVVHDKEDAVVSFEHGRAIADLAPQATFMETTGLGHRAILRAQKVVDAIVDFVADGVSTRKGVAFADTLGGELFLRDTRWQAA